MYMRQAIELSLQDASAISSPQCLQHGAFCIRIPFPLLGPWSESFQCGAHPLGRFSALGAATDGTIFKSRTCPLSREAAPLG